MIQKVKIFDNINKLPKKIKKLDAMGSALYELFYIENPTLKKDSPETKSQVKKYIKQSTIKGVWAYYPWRELAVHIPTKEIYYRLRTARNRNLISEEKQKKYNTSCVGVAGLSVGSAVVSALTLSGGPQNIKIADHDIIEITNLNRIRAKLLDVGSNKAHVAAKEILELDPYINVDVWDNGLKKDTVEDFIIGNPKLDVFVDEMDDIGLKITSRIKCRKHKIPVVMGTDNGDGVIVDIERFDIEPDRPLFHGKLTPDEEKMEDFSGSKSTQMAIKIIDSSYFTELQQDSILNIGKTLSGVAQLGTAATIAGSAVAYAIRRIVTGENMPSGRYILSPEQIFIPNYNSPSSKNKREEKTKKFVKITSGPRKN